MKTFSGSGGMFGGGGGSSTPYIQPDNLRTNDRIEVILGLCTGPIKGLTNGDQSYYIADTQVQNADGSYNYPLFSLDILPGHTPGEVIVPVLGGFDDWRYVDHPWASGETFYYTTTGNQLDHLTLRLNFSQLYETGTDVQLAQLPGVNAQSTFIPKTFSCLIEWMSLTAPGSSYVNPFPGPYQIVGKTKVSEIHEIRFPVSGAGPYIVKVTNQTTNTTADPCVVTIDGFYETTAGVFGTARSTVVGIQFAAGTAVIRTTDYPQQRADGTYGIDFLAVRFPVAQLFNTNPSNGNVTQCSIVVRIEYKQTSQSTWTTALGADITITGKITAGIEVEQYRWPVKPVDDTYDIRCTLITAPSANDTVYITWESFEEIVGGAPHYDGVAIAHIVGQSSNTVSSTPSLWGLFDLKLCKIPSNYDPYARTYTGVWDGTFKEDWTSNPAWCMYDLGMNEVDGFRAYWPNFSLDRFDVYAAGQWCDTMVPNGSGGLQPRYTYNGIISDAQGAKDQLRYMAGVFNGVLIDDLNGNVRVVYDNDDPAVALFTPENVLVPGFSYSYTDPATRYNDITVHFNDPNIQYVEGTRNIYDSPSIARYGRIPLDFAAVGCTDPHEAVRRAAYKMITGLTETEIISFSTNRQGLLLKPLRYILVADPDMGRALTGRIKSLDISRTQVTIRDAMYLELGVQYSFQTHMPNPNYPATSDDMLTVVTIPFYAPTNGATFILELVDPLPAGVDDNSQFSVGCEGNIAGVPKVYRITKIEETDGNPDAITIEGISVNRNKWTLVDAATDVAGISYTNLLGGLAPPTGVTVSSEVDIINGVSRSDTIVTWIASIDARTILYDVQYRRSGETDWIDIKQTPGTRVDIYDIPSGQFDFRVQGQAGSDLASVWVGAINQALGVTVPPDDVTGVKMTVLGSTIHLNWNAVVARDLAYYWVRYTPLLPPLGTWEGAQDLIAQVVATSVAVPAMVGTFFVKAVNSTGTPSVNAGSVATLTNIPAANVADNLSQDPAWSGTLTNLTVVGGILKLNLGGGNTGSYEFLTTDLGQVFTCRIVLAMVATGELLGEFVSDWPTLADVPTMSGTTGSDFSFTTQIKTWDGTTWSAYRAFMTGDYTGQRFSFLITFTSVTPNVIPELLSLSSSVQMPDRLVTGNSVTVPTGGLAIVYDHPFHVSPAITINPKNSSTGDYYTITAESNAGFTINFYDSGNAAISRIIDWVSVGYGGL